jgi:hypothetical protein
MRTEAASEVQEKSNMKLIVCERDYKWQSEHVDSFIEVNDSLKPMYEPISIKDAIEWIKNNYKSYYQIINYNSYNVSRNNVTQIEIDFGSHTQFAYVWDITEEELDQFVNGRKDIIAELITYEEEK